MPQPRIDDTHDPGLRSWVESANDPATDFPVQNLPYCLFERADRDGADHPRQHLGVRIGGRVLDLAPLADAGLLGGTGSDWQDALDAFYAERSAHARLRARLSALLSAGSEDLRTDKDLVDEALLPLDAVRFVRDHDAPRNYTDFYASIHHATRVGSMFRPDNPLLPNYKWVPIGYHGRASSIVPSGTAITRPSGQTRADDADAPRFGPCRLLDYELEVGIVITRGNELGSPIAIDEAEDHILGLCLVNDWSARDLQKWEYQPLGPFLAKSFATTVSPYIVTMDALAPFRCPAYPRPDGDPRPLAYLASDANEAHGGIDLTLEVFLASEQMRQRGMSPVRLSIASFRDMYWTPAQMVTHHASNGCNLQPGDLLASGTVSGPSPDSAGCLLERTWDGPGKPRKPIELPTGEKRLFLEDGDEVILKGFCEREGFRRIGLGECRGVVQAARKG